MEDSNTLSRRTIDSRWLLESIKEFPRIRESIYLCAMAIWKVEPNLEAMNDFSKNTLTEHLGMKFVEYGDVYLKMTMPVDERTVQPYGILHGGASVALAETIGSVGAVFCCDPDTQRAVGLSINANHLKAVRSGLVTAIAKPVRIGRTTQVWEVKIYNEDGEMNCISRITMAIVPKERI